MENDDRPLVFTLYYFSGYSHRGRRWHALLDNGKVYYPVTMKTKSECRKIARQHGYTHAVFETENGK